MFGDPGPKKPGFFVPGMFLPLHCESLKNGLYVEKYANAK
jgi:hypothetical protein